MQQETTVRSTPVLDLLKDSTKWCRGAFGMDRDWYAVGSASPNAVRWCLSGAINRCYPKTNECLHAFSKVVEAIKMVSPHYRNVESIADGHIVACFNDESEHAKVIEVLQLAQV